MSTETNHHHVEVDHNQKLPFNSGDVFDHHAADTSSRRTTGEDSQHTNQQLRAENMLPIQHQTLIYASAGYSVLMIEKKRSAVRKLKVIGR